MTKLAHGLALSAALSVTLSLVAAPSHAEAQASDWPSVSDFAEPGPFAITHERNTGPNGAYDIVRPADLGAEGRDHPIVSWNNGTLYPIDQYQDLLDHWASHGFVVIGGHTNSTAGGAVHNAAIDWIVAENSRGGSPYQGMLDTEMIGAAGHSQGGGATITAGANVPDPAGIVTAMPLMPISMFEDEHLDQQAAAMMLVSATEDGRANRVADQAMESVPTEFVDAQFVGVHEDAWNPGIHGATVAWLRYQLMGDEAARAQFYPQGSCGLCGAEDWERLRYRNAP